MSGDPAQARDARWRNILLGGTSAGAARAVSVACNLVQVPIALRLLGADGFGLWATLQAASGFVAMLDLGTGYRLQNHAAESAAHARHSAIRDGVQLALVITGSVAALASMIAATVGTDSWAKLMGLGATLRGELDSTLCVLLILCALALPTNLGPRLASGLQRNWLVGATQAVASFLGLAWITACAAWKPPVFITLAGALALPTLANAALLVFLMRTLPRENSAPADAPLSLGAWLRGGLPFLAPQMSAALRTTVPPFIVASLFGVAAVTPFNLIQRLLMFLNQPQQWMLDPMWSAYTDAASRRDVAWIARAFRFSLGATLAIAVAPLLTAIFWGPRFLEWWSGFPAAALPAGLLLWLALWQAGMALTQPFSICLNGLGRMRGQTLYGPPCVVLGLAGMVWLGASRGLGWAAAPGALVTLLLNVPCAVLDLRAVLRRLPAGG